MRAQPMRLGVSDPVSLAGPTAEDKASSAALEEMLHARSLYEDDAGRQLRERVLGRLNELVTWWLQVNKCVKGPVAARGRRDCEKRGKPVFAHVWGTRKFFVAREQVQSLWQQQGEGPKYSRLAHTASECTDKAPISIHFALVQDRWIYRYANKANV
jgi:hypothetical protein